MATKVFNRSVDMFSHETDEAQNETAKKDNNEIVRDGVVYAPVLETKTERTQIVLRKSTKAALKKISKKETGGSLNELISRICEEYIENYAK